MARTDVRDGRRSCPVGARYARLFPGIRVGYRFVCRVNWTGRGRFTNRPYGGMNSTDMSRIGRDWRVGMVGRVDIGIGGGPSRRGGVADTDGVASRPFWDWGHASRRGGSRTARVGTGLGTINGIGAGRDSRWDVGARPYWDWGLRIP